MQSERKAEEWSTLADAAASEDYVPEEDPVFLEDINRLCTFGLKAMLKARLQRAALQCRRMWAAVAFPVGQKAHVLGSEGIRR